MLQLGELERSELSLDTRHGVGGIEDLLPARIALAAAQRYTADYLARVDADVLAKAVTVDQLDITKKKGMFGAVETALAAAADEDFHLDESGFARSVIEVLADGAPEKVARLEGNFRCLFRAPASQQRRAERAQFEARTGDRIRRELRSSRLTIPRPARARRLRSSSKSSTDSSTTLPTPTRCGSSYGSSAGHTHSRRTRQPGSATWQPC